jgi:predicted lipid carrier protein YhbT
MDCTTTVPAVPPPLAHILRPLPLFPLRLVLQRMVERLGQKKTGLFSRLDIHAGKAFLVDPVDLPFILCLKPHPARPVIEPRRREEAGFWDARIAGPLAALIGMVQGAYDGDALFFSRQIVIEGDTEAVVALRNALDDAEIDLAAEAAAVLGPAGPIVASVTRWALSPLSRFAGFDFIGTDDF